MAGTIGDSKTCELAASRLASDCTGEMRSAVFLIASQSIAHSWPLSREAERSVCHVSGYLHPHDRRPGGNLATLTMSSDRKGRANGIGFTSA